MKISVLGCGWLGFPLAQRLVSKTFSVKGSTTTKSKLTLLKQNEIEPYLIKLPDSFKDKAIEPFWESDLLILNIPPGRSNKEALKCYPEIVNKVVEKAKEHTMSWIIFASSTSVYSQTGGLTTEEDAEPGTAARPSGETLLQAEQIVRDSGIDYTILRFGGLYGYGRHPVNYLSGKNNLNGASKPVNLVHQVDCVNIVLEIILQKKRNEIYNVVSDGHPPRKEFYQSAAQHFNLPLPSFLPKEEKDYRIVSNEKVKKDLFYEFSYPNPMDHTP
jgi:nucleoside-diphosphate-sugar epimerase